MANFSKNISGDASKPPVVPKKATLKPGRQNKTDSALTGQHNTESRRRTPDPNSFDKNSHEYISGLQTALSNFEGSLRSFQIPCYVSEAAAPIGTNSEDKYDPSQKIKYRY